MMPTANATSLDRLRPRALALAFVLLCVAALPAAGQVVGPTFAKAFNPDTIGPGSVSMLTFTIDNSNGSGAAGELAFSDTLPASVVLAAPAFVSNTCGGTVSAPNGGGTIMLDDGMVGIGGTCTVVVNVTSSTAGSHLNTSEDLTWKIGAEAGNSETASDELTVDNNLPGFVKIFAPGTVALGGRSTLTFTVDNTANESDVISLLFQDTLPAGMVVANPANASTTCQTPPALGTLTANPGASVISYSYLFGSASFPAVEAGATCTVIVDVIGGAVGLLGNVSGELDATLEGGGGSASSGKAAAVLEVTGSAGLLQLGKQFIDDPAAPGGTVTLQFTVTNKSRDDSATGITFSDDLETTLTGLAPSGALPTDPCGAGSSLAFSMGVLTLTGGTLPPSNGLPPDPSCTFGVTLGVPAGATPGAYSNTAGPVSGDVGGSPETGNSASDQLFVVAFPILTKAFTGDPVGAGGTVTLGFTITNPGASGMTAIAFVDELTDSTGAGGGPTGGFLPSPVSVTLPPVPNPPCGAGSSLALISLGSDREGLSLTGGSLAAAGMAGDSCSFTVTLTIPAGFPSGTYTNTTREITATLAAATVTGPPASDDVVVVGAPQLSKEFTDDPVAPGGMVTLEFTLSHDEFAPGDATGITFTDNLAAALADLEATLPPSPNPPCGAGSSLTGSVGDTFLTFAGGTLMPGESCTFSVSLTVPMAAASGFHTNTTSDVTATVSGVTAKSTKATDKLLVTGLLFSKAFSPDQVIAGGTSTLSFTLDNTTGTTAATGIFFTDNLAADLTGLAATLPPTPNPPCGVGSSLTGFSGNTFLTFSGGSVPAGSSCTFSVTVTVPPGTADDVYANVTSSLTATIGTGVTLPPATDELTVDSDVLALSKEFTDDPVNPGDPVTLEFTLENLDLVNPASAIAFSDNLGDAGGTLLGLEAQAPALFNDCGGMAVLPATTFSYSGGSLPAGGTCTIRLSLIVPGGPLPGGVFPNATSGVTGTILGLPVTGDPTSDDLEVDTLTFSKAFDGPTTATGTAVVTFTITNLDSLNAVAGLAFSDNLGAVVSGLAATLPPTPNPPCGAGSVLAGSSFLTLSGGNLAAGGACSFDVTVTVPGTASAGSFLNTTSQLFDSGIPVAPPAKAFLKIEPAPAFAKAFAPDTISVGGVSTLTFTINNTASALAASGLDFTDSLPAGLVVATPSGASTTCTGGTLTAVAGSAVIAYTGGSVAAGASCTVQANVTSAAPGGYANVTGDLTSSSGNSGPANDTLTVQAPPSFAKVFVPNPVGESFDTTLTFTIDNSASSFPASDLDFLDMLPFDLVVAAVPAVVNNCGGSVVANPGSTTISLSNGTLAAGASCTISVQVNAPSPGAFPNTTGDLTSTLGNSGKASNTLGVNACTAPDGLNKSLSGLVLGTKTVVVCKTITLLQHFKVDGPSGNLTLRAGISVVIQNGVQFGPGSTVTIEIDPSLIP